MALLFLTFSVLGANPKKLGVLYTVTRSARGLLDSEKRTKEEGFNDWGGRENDDFIPGEVTKTTPSGDETT